MYKEDFDLNSMNSKYKISITLYLPEDKNIRKMIIALHGFGGDKISTAIVMLAKSLTENGIGVITFDFPGHGDSTTDGYNFTVRNCIDDVNTVENYVRKRFSKVDIGFFATSYGAYVTLLKLNEQDTIYNSIVLRCPAIDMRSVFEKSILLNKSVDEFFKEGKEILGYDRKIIITKEYYNELVENDIFDLYNTKNKILIIHGTEDDMAPPIYSEKLRDKFKDRIKIEFIEGADHRFKKPGELDKVIKIATDYIVNN